MDATSAHFPPRSARVIPPVREAKAWRETFDRAAREEPRFAFGPRFLRGDVARALARIVPADARVLEVGCGRGEVLAALTNRVRHGIDASPAAVERARIDHGTLDLRVDDALTFKSDERYDAIVCDRMVHSTPDIQALLENLSQHLTDTGRIYLSCYNYLWEPALRAAEALGFKFPTPENNWLSESDLTNLFDLADLEVIKYEDRVLVPAPVPLVAALANRYLAPLPLLRHLSVYRLYVLRRRAHPHAAPATPPKVTVVVPARNEEGNVPAIIARTPVMGGGTELVFVEGGSTDNTRAAIERAIETYDGPLTLSLYTQPGKGKGDAVRTGFAKAHGDLFMILDADLTVPPEDLPKFYDVMVQGKADYVHGTRLVYPMEQEAMRFLNKLGNIGFSKLFTFLLNQPLKDTLCGTKVVWARDWARITEGRRYFGNFDPFGDFDMIFGAARLNLKIIEIPIRYRDRTYGTTNISRFRHGWMLLQMSAVAATKLKFV
jgi:SAM-dependent methyltransferase